MVLIVYGTLMKHGFKLRNTLKQEFWLGKDLMQFTTSQKFENG
jgi:hypothetical protein